MLKLQDKIYFDYDIISRNNNKEMVFEGYLVYDRKEIIPLEAVVAISLLNDNNGYYDFDNNYIYVILNDEIIEIFDLLNKKRITDKNEQQQIFKNFKQIKSSNEKQLIKKMA